MKIGYTLPALADLESILSYIAAHSPRGARRVQARMRVIIDLLLEYPKIGTPTDDPGHPARDDATLSLSRLL